MAQARHGKRRIAMVVVAALLVAAGIGAWSWWRSQSSGETGPLMASGAVESSEYLVAATMAGRITELGVEEGDEVTAGQAIVRLDDAALRLQVSQAEQGVKAASAQLEQAKDDGSDAEVAAAEARLEQAKAAVALARVQLGYATVTAPATGTVVAIAANAGQNASPGRTLLTIADPADLFVRVFVPETRIGDVRTGQNVRVTTDSTDDTYEGKVRFIASQAEFTPNNVETKEQRAKLVYEVRVSVLDGSGALKSGMPVDVTFE